MKHRNVADDRAARAADPASSGSAADRFQAVVVLAAPYAQGVADRLVPLARAAGGRAVPVVVSTAGRIGPLSSEALRRVSPLGKQAVVLLVPYAQQAAGRVAPLAQTARQRGKATLAAARGELSLPDEPTSKGGLWPKRLAVFTGAAGVGVLVARKFLGSRDADLTADSTVPPDDEVATLPTPPAAAEEGTAAAGDQDVPTTGKTPADATGPVPAESSVPAETPHEEAAAPTSGQ